jgi:hypothetical protein
MAKITKALTTSPRPNANTSNSQIGKRANSLRSELSDINGDGHFDFLVSFDMASVNLHPRAQKARLTGWLKNSQAFIGEDRVTVVG